MKHASKSYVVAIAVGVAVATLFQIPVAAMIDAGNVRQTSTSSTETVFTGRKSEITYYSCDPGSVNVCVDPNDPLCCPGTGLEPGVYNICGTIVNLIQLPVPIITNCPTGVVEKQMSSPGSICIDLEILGADDIAIIPGDPGVSANWSSNQLCFQADTEGLYTFEVVAKNNCDPDMDATCTIDVNVSICLQLPVDFKQSDPAWGDDVYDDATNWPNIIPQSPSIHRWGCAMTTLAMVVRAFGIDTDPEGAAVNPGNLNQWLQSAVGGYVGQGITNWEKVFDYSQGQVQYDFGQDFGSDAASQNQADAYCDQG